MYVASFCPVQVSDSSQRAADSAKPRACHSLKKATNIQMFGWERAWFLRFVETKTRTHWSDWSRPCILGPLLEASRRSNGILDPFVCGLTLCRRIPGACLIRDIPIHSGSRIACAKKGALRSLWICPSRPGRSLTGLTVIPMPDTSLLVLAVLILVIMQPRICSSKASKGKEQSHHSWWQQILEAQTCRNNSSETRTVESCHIIL